jgi:hypothetical protein
MNKIIIISCLVFCFGCINNEKDFVEKHFFSTKSDSNYIEKINSEDTLYYLLNDKIIAMKVIDIEPDSSSQITKYIDIFKSKYPYPNESIYFTPNGDIIEDSSTFYHCKQIGSDLLISWCFKNKTDSASIKIDGDFDTYFVSHKQYKRIMFKGNNFLVKDYMRFSINDTFRAVVSPRVKTFFKNGEPFHEIGMIFIEYPSQIPFEKIK